VTRRKRWKQELSTFGTTIASDWSRAGVAMGQRSKDSSKEAVEALKPLAQFAVYTFAIAEQR
jgi:hypothetical protein